MRKETFISYFLGTWKSPNKSNHLISFGMLWRATVLKTNLGYDTQVSEEVRKKIITGKAHEVDTKAVYSQIIRNNQFNPLVYPYAILSFIRLAGLKNNRSY